LIWPSGTASHSFFLRQSARAGVPTVVCGLTPYNMGGADEYVDIGELLAVGDIFALTAFDFLNVT